MLVNLLILSLLAWPMIENREVETVTYRSSSYCQMDVIIRGLEGHGGDSNYREVLIEALRVMAHTTVK